MWHIRHKNDRNSSVFPTSNSIKSIALETIFNWFLRKTLFYLLVICFVSNNRLNGKHTYVWYHISVRWLWMDTTGMAVIASHVRHYHTLESTAHITVQHKLFVSLLQYKSYVWNLLIQNIVYSEIYIKCCSDGNKYNSMAISQPFLAWRRVELRHKQCFSIYIISALFVCHSVGQRYRNWLKTCSDCSNWRLTSSSAQGVRTANKCSSNRFHRSLYT